MRSIINWMASPVLAAAGAHERPSHAAATQSGAGRAAPDARPLPHRRLARDLLFYLCAGQWASRIAGLFVASLGSCCCW